MITFSLAQRKVTKETFTPPRPPLKGRMQLIPKENLLHQSFGMIHKACALAGESWLFLIAVVGEGVAGLAGGAAIAAVVIAAIAA